MKEGRGHRGSAPRMRYNPKAKLDSSQVVVYRGKVPGDAWMRQGTPTAKATGTRPKPKRK